MANPKSKKRRKILVFSAIGLVLAGLTTAAIFRKREPVITVQTEKVARRNITETVVANGKIQPVLQVKISPEVSGEIIELPVKEGQSVKKGDLLVKIKPDSYIANVRSAEAQYLSSASGKDLAQASMRKAELEFKRNEEMFLGKLESESTFLEFKTGFEVAQAQYESATHQVAVARAALDRAKEELAKTTIASPLDGTISKLNSRLGERVVGTAMMTGTEIMIVSDLNAMEARVDVGTVTEIANSSKDAGVQGGGGGGGQSQEATKFEVRIRVDEKEELRPGMSVTADIETRYRTNVLTVPIQSVTTRLPKGAVDEKQKKTAKKDEDEDMPEKKPGTKKQDEANKPVEVVFVTGSDTVKMIKVKRGIGDDEYVEIAEGLTEGQEAVSGSYKAINRELEDGKRIKRDNRTKSEREEKKSP